MRASRLVPLLVLLVGAPPAGAEELPAANQALLLLRTLAFDRNLKARAGGSVEVCILYKQNLPASDKARVELQASLQGLAQKTTVWGLPVEVSALAWQGSTQLKESVASHRCRAFYVAPGLPEALGDIAGAAQAAGILTFAPSADHVQQGLAVALVRREGRARLVINLKASRAQGADLDSNLLQLSEVIR